MFKIDNKYNTMMHIFCRADVFDTDFEHIPYLCLVFLVSTLNK